MQKAWQSTKWLAKHIPLFPNHGYWGAKWPEQFSCKKKQKYGESLTLDLISKIGLGGHFHRKWKHHLFQDRYSFLRSLGKMTTDGKKQQSNVANTSELKSITVKMFQLTDICGCVRYESIKNVHNHLLCPSNVSLWQGTILCSSHENRALRRMYNIDDCWIRRLFWPFSPHVQFLLQARKHSHLEQPTACLNHVLGKRFRQVLGTFTSRQDWLSYFIHFSMTIILNCALAELWNCSMFLQNWRKPAVGWTKWGERGRSYQIPAKHPPARF